MILRVRDPTTHSELVINMSYKEIRNMMNNYGYKCYETNGELTLMEEKSNDQEDEEL